MKKIKDLIKEEKEEEKVVKDDKIIININPGNNENQASIENSHSHSSSSDDKSKSGTSDDVYPTTEDTDERHQKDSDEKHEEGEGKSLDNVGPHLKNLTNHVRYPDN